MPCKLQILINKQDDLSDEEFHRDWSVEHRKIYLNSKVVKKKKNITYSQIYKQPHNPIPTQATRLSTRGHKFHVETKDTDALEGLGVPVGKFQGIVTMVAESMEDLSSVFQDEEDLRVVSPNEHESLKRNSAVMMIGEEQPKNVDGKFFAEI